MGFKIQRNCCCIVGCTGDCSERLTHQPSNPPSACSSPLGAEALSLAPCWSPAGALHLGDPWASQSASSHRQPACLVLMQPKHSFKMSTYNLMRDMPRAVDKACSMDVFTEDMTA